MTKAFTFLFLALVSSIALADKPFCRKDSGMFQENEKTWVCSGGEARLIHDGEKDKENIYMTLRVSVEINGKQMSNLTLGMKNGTLSSSSSTSSFPIQYEKISSGSNEKIKNIGFVNAGTWLGVIPLLSENGQLTVLGNLTMSQFNGTATLTDADGLEFAVPNLISKDLTFNVSGREDEVLSKEFKLDDSSKIVLKIQMTSKEKHLAQQ